MKIHNRYKLPIVDSFLRMYGDLLQERFGNVDFDIEILPLRDEENSFGDVLVRLGKKIYISESQTGFLGLSEPELYAAIAHELGHILYNTTPWAPDSENRADTLAAELGLGTQMISVIEKIIGSRRYRHITRLLVQRIQFLKHLA